MRPPITLAGVLNLRIALMIEFSVVFGLGKDRVSDERFHIR